MWRAQRIQAFTIALFILFGSTSETAVAQDYVLNELYGSGVHAFFSGDYHDALDYLTQAIDEGSQDPRVFYFRGLTQKCLGYDAEADFRRGAELEAADPNVFPVGRSLERIQGETRHLLESYRRKGRIDARRLRRLRDRTRYQTPADPSRRGPPAKRSRPGADTTDPFVDEERPVGTGPVEPAPEPKARMEEPSDSGDVFGDPEDAMSEEDSFGEPSREAEEADPFGESGEDTEEDPFQGGMEEDDDLFGEDDENPFG